MPKSGRLLEVMVHRLQELLVHEGVIVTSPDKFCDKDGKVIGEIDVTLRFEFGGCEVVVGMECRDWPSANRRQGVGWIEAIKGKRDRLTVDKMIAVSTTGFTEPAVDFADSCGIDLWAVEDVSKLDLHGWFEVLDLYWVDDSYEISGVVDFTTIPRTPPSTGRTAVFLRSAASGELVPLKEYIQPELDRHFERLQVSPGNVQEVETTLEFGGPIEAVADQATFRIGKMTVPVKMRREVVPGKFLLNACRSLRDDEDDEIVALAGRCQIETKDGIRVFVVSAKKNTPDGSLKAKFDFLDEDLERSEMPAGTRFTLLGPQEGLEERGE